MWSKSRKFRVFKVGLGVSKRCMNNERSSNVAFLRPVVPEESETNPAFFVNLKRSITRFYNDLYALLVFLR